jgi:hypothetical protein
MRCEVHVSPQGGLLSVCVPAREPQAPDERESSNQEVHREAWREQGRYHSSPCSASFLATRASRPDSSRPSLLRLPSAPHSSPHLGAFLQSQWASQASLPPVHDDGPNGSHRSICLPWAVPATAVRLASLNRHRFTAAEAGAGRGRRSWPRWLIRQNGGPRCPRRRAVRPAYPRTQDAAALQSWSTFSTSQATYQVARAAERFLAWLKGGFRWLGLRYERLSSTFAAMVYLASFPTSLGGF